MTEVLNHDSRSTRGVCSLRYKWVDATTVDGHEPLMPQHVEMMWSSTYYNTSQMWGKMIHMNHHLLIETTISGYAMALKEERTIKHHWTFFCP